MSKSLKNISVVATATFASRVLGLARETLTAAVFGTSAWASAFATAFQLPNLFRRLLAEGGMTAAFVPTLNDELEKRKMDGAYTMLSQVSSWLLLVSGSIVAIAMLFFSQAAWISAAGHAFGADADTIGRWLIAAKLTVVLFPYLVMVCLAAAYSAALNTFSRFLEPALSPIWLNVCMIGSLVAGIYAVNADTETKMYWFCGGVLLGGVLQMLVPAWVLVRMGWRPRFDLSWSSPVQSVARLMGPTVLGSSVYLINMVVSRFLGLSLNDAAVSVLNYATRLMELPIGVFAIAVSTVVFPLISRCAAQGAYDQMGEAYRKGMRLILLINIPAAAGLAVLSQPIIRVLFQHGAFRASDTQLMLPILAVSAVGLPFFSFVNLILRAFYAYKDMRTPVVAAVISFVLNVVLSLILMERLSTVGLALASNLAVVAQAIYLQWRLAQRGPQFAIRHLWSDLIKILVAAAAMGLLVAGLWHLWQVNLPTSFSYDVLAIVLCIGAGVAAYAGLVWVLRVEGREEFALLARKLTTKFGKKSASPA